MYSLYKSTDFVR